jgi:hypothetical protein
MLTLLLCRFLLVGQQHGVLLLRRVLLLHCAEQALWGAEPAQIAATATRRLKESWE